MRTVPVTEWVPENYETFRTVYRTQCVQETYTAFRTICVPEVRTQVITVNQTIPEVHHVTRTTYVSVPTVEHKTVMKRVAVCKPVTTVTRKTVDMGHYECREVPAREGCLTKLRKMCSRDDCCCEPCPPPMKTVKVWCPNKVCVETPHTRMVKTYECVPTVVPVTVCRMVPQQCTVPVTTYRCVPVQKTVSSTVMVAKQVPYQGVRTVARCVPVQERVSMCRLVPHTVLKQVPACDTGCEAPAPCCH